MNKDRLREEIAEDRHERLKLRVVALELAEIGIPAGVRDEARAGSRLAPDETAASAAPFRPPRHRPPTAAMVWCSQRPPHSHAEPPGRGSGFAPPLPLRSRGAR